MQAISSAVVSTYNNVSAKALNPNLPPLLEKARPTKKEEVTNLRNPLVST